MTLIAIVALFIGLLALTFFFNLAEMALIAVRDASVEANLKSSPRALIVARLKKRPALFLAVIRAGDLITDLLMGALVVTYFSDAVALVFANIPILGKHQQMIAGLFVVLAVSYISLVSADLVPKSIALAMPKETAFAVARPISILILLTRPFLALLEGSSTWVLRVLGLAIQSSSSLTQEEIRSVLAQGVSAGTLLLIEGTMMERVLDLDQRSVRTVMTPRGKVEKLDTGMARDELHAALVNAKSSRLPLVKDGNLDYLIGIINRADALAALTRDPRMDLAGIAVEPKIVSENTSVLCLLDALKNSPTHMVLVASELGELVGLATLADILKAVAGDLTDKSPYSTRSLPS